MRDDRQRLVDIEEAIADIERYAGGGRDAFDRDELIQTWILHHLQIVGEAVRMLSADFRQKHPEVDWARVIGTRNVLVHHYFGIDKALVWHVVEHDLPTLKSKIAALLRESQPGP